MGDMKSLILREATVSDNFIIEDYTIEETPYTVKPMDGMTESLHESEKHPILVLEGNKMVAFFILQTGDTILNYVSNPHAILLKAHSVDKQYLKQGYGKASLEKLPRFINEHFPSITEIILLIDYDNISGQMMYIKSGFKDTRNKVKELDGYKFVYSKKLTNEMSSN
ncbi:putative acyltransferase [Carnobacterium sp. 17-4]|uniref:GNAT family N-acetyltransferase n=1 Tax=Carnobacterium sp. (strain 17-4) TaxID=208596 RepID=UPI0002058E98|nr:GNAT family N-acetyltransferase [Carnobacterium sp. 17-4]AEB29644.1 putative acyltransferase [Carnobacterium sp. 17-4]